MTRLAHISDLHFGREDPALVAGLLASLIAEKPDAIVVSGDLTQRARKSQFRQARAFLRALPKAPRLVVPGNHDISATNLIERLARPLKRYRKFITQDLAPYLEIEGAAIAGIDTVRLLATKDGRINRAQVLEACRQVSRAPASALRIVVTHPPLDLPLADHKHAPVTRSRMAMQAFARARVDLFLSGHLHTGQSIVSSLRYPGSPYAAVVAHAGTAVSTRTRAEPNGWNLIECDQASLLIQQMVWNRKAFAKGLATRFQHSQNGWIVQS
jgi:3',5'-cyclic AMP phosphodiesterase CpdA